MPRAIPLYSISKKIKNEFQALRRLAGKSVAPALRSLPESHIPQRSPPEYSSVEQRPGGDPEASARRGFALYQTLISSLLHKYAPAGSERCNAEVQRPPDVVSGRNLHGRASFSELVHAAGATNPQASSSLLAAQLPASGPESQQSRLLRRESRNSGRLRRKKRRVPAAAHDAPRSVRVGRQEKMSNLVRQCAREHVLRGKAVGCSERRDSVDEDIGHRPARAISRAGCDAHRV
jgi:hypothetical protein